ncbi:MAG: regulator of sigma protease [Gaiellaceae bacterium]|jgi:regulator of sigma E protease|nr:regulator of sigma protease [Gaiellaceae bacterium]
MSLLIAILGLELLVLVHEAGHFFTARALGMKPTAFFIGFRPALFSVKRGGVEYGIGAIPLGGFISIPGMQRPSPRDVGLYFGPAQKEAPELTPTLQALERALEAEDLVAVDQALGRLEVEIAGTKLSPGALKAARRGLRDLSGGVRGRPYWRQPASRRILVSFAGPAVNIVLALVLITAVLATAPTVYRLGVAFSAAGSTKIVDVSKGYPAQEIGLRPGDVLRAVNGKSGGEQTIHDAIASSHGAPITVTIERSGKRLTLGPVRAKRVDPPTLGTAAWDSVKISWEQIRATGVAIGHLFTGKNRNELSGPVGTVRISSQAARNGVRDYLGILGIISLSLGVFNLLPILPLDGGHILMSSIEAIRRRALGRVVYERFAAVGIALVLLVAFIVLTNDLSGKGPG